MWDHRRGKCFDFAKLVKRLGRFPLADGKDGKDGKGAAQQEIWLQNQLANCFQQFMIGL
jgi:hypothetical protein